MGRPDDRFPSVSAELVEALAAVFPDRCPAHDATEREVWIAVGGVDVVKFLRAKAKEQNETLYEDNE